ncbi:unnamed protein product [Effrenium voratum]|uniref:Beta-lactamase-related domain-containing protein n=1 Tax=Effrenium voratum TaxID=2562239 RepID=A0AA36N0B9_9DINO|nr:unnamed protein product [Effrenium voratum]
MAGPGAGEWAKGVVDWTSHEPLDVGAANLFKTFPGRRCILVAHEGRLVYEHYVPGAGPEERIELDSAAKTVSALLIGVLVTQGKLDLDTPLRQYNVTPSAYWGKGDEYWPMITARHLLTHTSGLGTKPPGKEFEYNSGEHIQHLSHLIHALTRPPNGHWASPVDWAEEAFAEPLGLPGLFLNDGLDGQISIGGGQQMSCPQLARIGQLLVNRGKWPMSSAPSWPIDWLPWATNRTSLVQLISEAFIDEMTRPSFPEVVSTYGFLLWLNRAPEPSDAECCMCTCGACFDVPGPPIFGINEEAWFATGFLTRYLIVLPQRNAFVVSLGMDLTGSTPCAISWSWFSLTYDDSFGALLHYLVMKNALPLPASTTTTTATSSSTTLTQTTLSTTTLTTVTQTTTVVTAAAGGGIWPFWGTWTSTSTYWWHMPFEMLEVASNSSSSTSMATGRSVTTTGPRATTTAITATVTRSTSLASTSRWATSETTATTTFDVSKVIYNHGTKTEVHRRKKRRKEKKYAKSFHYQPGYVGGSCSCSCPIDQDFGRCYPLPNISFAHWHQGQEACDVLGAGYLRSERSCPSVGLVQPCESNSWAIGGSTRDVCGRDFWKEVYGLNCSQTTFCHTHPGDKAPVLVDTRRMATCFCEVQSWGCMYDSEPCDPDDSYYVLGSARFGHDVLQHWAPVEPAAPAWPVYAFFFLTMAALACFRSWRRQVRTAAAPAGYAPLASDGPEAQPPEPVEPPMDVPEPAAPVGEHCELAALLRPEAARAVGGHALPKRCGACSCWGRRVGALAQGLQAMGARGFNWSAGLNRLQRRDLAELLLSICAPLAQESPVEQLCAALDRLPWSQKTAPNLLPDTAPPLPPGEAVEAPGCDYCHALALREEELAQALLSLGAKMFSWSADLGQAQRRLLVTVVLDCCRPCCFKEEVAAFCAHMERLRWTELTDLPASPHLAWEPSTPSQVITPSQAVTPMQAVPAGAPRELASAPEVRRKHSLRSALQQDIQVEEKKVLSQLQELLATGKGDASLRQLEEMLSTSLRERASMEGQEASRWTAQPEEAWRLRTSPGTERPFASFSAASSASAASAASAHGAATRIQAAQRGRLARRELEERKLAKAAREEAVDVSIEVKVPAESGQSSVASDAGQELVTSSSGHSSAATPMPTSSRLGSSLPLRAAPVKQVRRTRPSEATLSPAEELARRRQAREQRLGAEVDLARRRAKELWQRQQREAEERRQVAAVLRVQAAWRGQGARRAVRKLRRLCAEAAPLLQEAARSSLARREMLTGLQRREGAAARIQAQRRGCLARREVAQQRQALSAAVTRAAALFRGRRQRAAYLAEQQRRLEAATRLQALRRGHVAREQTQRERKEKTDATVKMQAAFRGQATRKQLAVEKQRREEAATKIQAIRRGNVSRQQAQQERDQKSQAATRIQAVFRGKTDRKRAAEEQQKREEAATKIQAIRRGNTARQQVTEEQQKREEAATKIQAIRRGNTARQQVTEEQQKREEAATKIQAIRRGNTARQQAWQHCPAAGDRGAAEARRGRNQDSGDQTWQHCPAAGDRGAAEARRGRNQDSGDQTWQHCPAAGDRGAAEARRGRNQDSGDQTRQHCPAAGDRGSPEARRGGSDIERGRTRKEQQRQQGQQGRQGWQRHPGQQG